MELWAEEGGGSAFGSTSLELVSFTSRILGVIGVVNTSVPAEQRAKAEVLYHGELGEDFRVVHFDHALDDLVPYFPADKEIIPGRNLISVKSGITERIDSG